MNKDYYQKAFEAINVSNYLVFSDTIDYAKQIFSEFYIKYSVEFYLREFNDSYDESNYQDDIKRLERVEKYIKSIL